MPIRVLDAATVGRIAAGEVVERPSSVAKELIENALDAGATSITVEVRDGGISYLRVTDNGCGIPADQAKMAFQNHATSKIQNEADLNDIRTLGFRGEALPSIASVARVTLTTRAKGAESGLRLTVEGGEFKEIKEHGCPEGTTFVVRDLFFNTPVRRGFLKKPAAEFGAVSDMVSRMILGNPAVSIRLINNERTVYHSFGDGNLRHAALAVYGRETAKKLIELDASSGGLSISGLIGVGECGRSNRGQQSFFVNGRVVRCALLTQALEQVCKSRVTIGQFPMCALHVTLPPHSVDVNVHPNKLEVRFRDELGMRQGAEALIQRAFEGERMLDVARVMQDAPEPMQKGSVRLAVAPEVREISRENPEKPAPVVLPVENVRIEQKALAPDLQGRAAPARPMQTEDIQAVQLSYGRVMEEARGAQILREPETRTVPMRVAEPEEMQSRPLASVEETVQQKSPLPSLRIIGVAFQTYIIVECGDRLLMIDQHAAHERILYEKYRGQLESGTASQQLLAPMIVAMSPRERALLMDNRALLMEVGYDVEPFGERDIQVRSVPHVLGKAELKPLFAGLVDRLDQLKSATLDRRRDEVIQASCKHAIKGGDELSDMEISGLVQQMLDTDAPPTCPHGRPVMWVLRRHDLEKQFKRIQ